MRPDTPLDRRCPRGLVGGRPSGQPGITDPAGRTPSAARAVQPMDARMVVGTRDGVQPRRDRGVARSPGRRSRSGTADRVRDSHVSSGGPARTEGPRRPHRCRSCTDSQDRCPPVPEGGLDRPHAESPWLAGSGPLEAPIESPHRAARLSGTSARAGGAGANATPRVRPIVVPSRRGAQTSQASMPGPVSGSPAWHAGTHASGPKPRSPGRGVGTHRHRESAYSGGFTHRSHLALCQRVCGARTVSPVARRGPGGRGSDRVS